MTIFDSIILGIVQGLTEFLPISSSGHLILVREFLGLDLVGTLTFDALLQLATTLAVVVYFVKDLFRLFRSFLKWIFGVKNVEVKSDIQMIGLLIIATIPAVVSGLLLEGYMDSVFRNHNLVILTLITGAVIMYFAERATQHKTQIKYISMKKALGIGLFQSLALIPGMSRSGMTISGGLFMKLERTQAVRFSFLMAVPILLGSGAKKAIDTISENGLLVDSVSIIGMITSFIVGLFAIHFLITFLKKNTLIPFVWYRVGLAVALIFLM